MSLGARRRRPPTPRFVANELWRRAGEVPSFHIAPARTGHAQDLITGNLLGTYNSASPAWAVGPDGVLALPAANAPVIEYDPVTLQCLGARIWGAVTNLILNSADLTAASYNKSATTVSASSTGPNNQTAYAVNEAIDTAGHTFTGSAVSVTGGATYTGSIFLKRSTVDWVQLTAGGAGFSNTRFVNFNLATGAIGIQSNSTGFIEPYPNGWYRCSITTSAVATTSTNSLILAFTNNTNSATRIPTYAGSTSNEVLAALVAFTATSGPAPYVPTTTTTASSTADVWSITGADFSRIYNQSAVTFYAEATRDTVPGTEFPVLIDARTANNNEIVQCSYLTEAVAGSFVRSNNAIQAELYPTGLANIRTRRIAAAFAQDNFATCANGGIVLTDSSGIMPLPDRINLGSVGGGQFLNGYIREAAIFRSRRPNANLQAMTS